MSNILAVLNLSTEEKPLEPSVDIDTALAAPEPEFPDHEMAIAVGGLESFSAMLDHDIFSGNPLTALSGCEGFAAGVMGCYVNDLTSRSGNEGFIDSVKKGLKATIDAIIDAIKKVLGFIFGKSKEEKEMDEIRKATNETIKSFEAAPPTVLNLKLGEEGVAELTTGLSESEREIVDEFMTADMTRAEFVTKMAESFKQSEKNSDEVKAAAKKSAEKSEQFAKQIIPQINSLTEDDKDKKKRVQEMTKQSQEDLKELKEESRKLAEENRAIRTKAKVVRNANRRMGKGRK